MSNKPYKALIGDDRRPCVDGPGNGFGYYAGTLWPEMRFSTAPDAEAAAKCCNEAYEQGRIAARREMRKAMGLD